MRYFGVALLLVSGVAQAQPEWTEVDRAIDAFFADALTANQVPGAVFALVQGGEIRLLRGFGLDNVAEASAADPRESFYLIGSVSKLITATAVMQCVERGRLGLHADVNDYLQTFEVPDTFDEPITLHHLLTHTAGFDDRFLELGVVDVAGLESQGDYLARRLPPRIQPPGVVINYSNFGIVLAAHLVEVVTGMRFEDYVDEHVATPLGMHAGGFHQPRPDYIRERLATSYTTGGVTPANWQDAASQVWSAGAYAATAEDMAKFMLAHLNLGKLGDSRILSPGTVERMHARQFINHPALTRGQCYGFHERVKNGERVIWHTGRVNSFAAQLVLVPGKDLGFFAAFNADDGDKTREPLFDLIASLFFPAMGPIPEPESRPVSQDEIERLTGAYRQMRSVRSSFLRVAFFGREVLLRPHANGLTHAAWPGFGAPEDTWVYIGDNVFQARDPGDVRRMAFVHDETGKVEHVCLEQEGFTSIDAFERLGWYETSWFHAVVLGVGTLMMLSVILRARTLMSLPGARLAGVAAVVTALCLTGFAAGLGLTIACIDPYRFAFGLPPVVLALLLLPLAASASATLLVVGLPFAWRKATACRAHLTLTAIAAWGVLGSLYYWNLLGFHR